MILKEHDPDATTPRGFDWTDWLAEIGSTETISSSSWASTPSGLTLTSGSIVTGSLKTQIKIAGGTLGVEYIVTNSVITSSGYHDDRSFRLLCSDQ